MALSGSGEQLHIRAFRGLAGSRPRTSVKCRIPTVSGTSPILAGLGIARLRINSLAANKSARASYERAGFAPYEIVYEKMTQIRD
jgi:hypothetical protein